MRRRNSYAADVTGGYDGDTAWITTVADSGAGSLREALEETDALWIRAHPQIFGQTITLDSGIEIQPNKTVDFLYSGVVIGGGGFGLILDMANADVSATAANVILRGLIIDGVVGDNEDEDGLQVLGDTAREIPADLVWVTQCTIADCADGLFDITRPIATRLDRPTRVTVDHCEFGPDPGAVCLAAEPGYDWNDMPDTPVGGKAMFIGDASGQVNWSFAQASTMQVTMHDNYFHGCLQRQPRVGNARVHVYNQLIENFGWPFDSAAPKGRAYETTTRGQLRLEGCITHQYEVSEACENDGTLVTHPATGGTVVTGPCAEFDCVWASGLSHPSVVFISDPESPIFTPPYEYTYIDPTPDSGVSLIPKIIANAGAR